MIACTCGHYWVWHGDSGCRVATSPSTTCTCTESENTMTDQIPRVMTDNLTPADWISDRRALIDAAPFTRLHAHEPGEDYGEDEAGFYVRRPLGDGTYDGLHFIPTDDLAAEQIERITDGVNSLPAALDALEAALKLHHPLTIQVLTGDCAAEECGHEELDDCQTRDFTYCSGCHEFAEKIDSYYPERDMRLTAYPCPTVTAIAAALGIEVQP